MGSAGSTSVGGASAAAYVCVVACAFCADGLGDRYAGKNVKKWWAQVKIVLKSQS